MDFPILVESIFTFLGASEVIFHFISFFDENQNSKQNSPNGTPRFSASHLGLFCLPMSHKKDARLLSLGRPEIFEKVAKIGVGCTFGSYKSPN